MIQWALLTNSGGGVDGDSTCSLWAIDWLWSLCVPGDLAWGFRSCDCLRFFLPNIGINIKMSREK